MNGYQKKQEGTKDNTQTDSFSQKLITWKCFMIGFMCAMFLTTNWFK